MDAEAKFLKKNARLRSLDAHPVESALVVNYSLEATILGQLGDPMVGERSDCQKIIRLKDLSAATDLAALAREVCARCKFIPQSRLPEVEQLLYYLQNRRDQRVSPSNNGVAPSSSFEGAAALLDSASASTERASLAALDDYIEMLYEDNDDKVRGTALIVQLARNADNLEALMHNETLIGALGRVLREDSKKIDLATNIVAVFCYFSEYSMFHSMISHFKIGGLTIEILKYEIKRYEVWEKEHNNQRMQEKSPKKFELKQEQLIKACVSLLLNLSEDLKTEVKIVGRGIIELLCALLSRRHNQPLVALTLRYLLKLSIFVENKLQMTKCNVVERVVKAFSDCKLEVAEAAVRLLMNLSFDGALRKQMMTCGVATPLLNLIEKSKERSLALRLLYHLSLDDEAKALLTYSECIPICMRELLGGGDAPELKALLVSLALNKRNAQLIAGDDGAGVGLLAERALQRGDPLLARLLGNMALHDGLTRPPFVPFLRQLADAPPRHCADAARPDFVFGLECIRILSNVDSSDIDWRQALADSSLLPWMRERLQPGQNDDDLLLEVVMLLATLSLSLEGAEMVYEHDLTAALLQLLGAKQDDDEIVLQVLFVFYRLLCHDSLRERLLRDSQVAAYLIDLVHDKNSRIRKLCDVALDIIGGEDSDWGRKIQEDKFRWHNAQWLEMVGLPDAAPLERRFALDDDDDDALQDADLFSELYGLQAEDILDEDDERPFSRLDHR